MCTYCRGTCVLFNFSLISNIKPNSRKSACYIFYLLVFASCFYGSAFYCIWACSGTQAVKFNTYLLGDGISSLIITNYFWAVSIKIRMRNIIEIFTNYEYIHYINTETQQLSFIEILISSQIRFSSFEIEFE